MIPALDLPRLPTSVKLMLTAFLALIGTGYLTAVANIYYRHQLADGKPGLTMDDLRAVYAGLPGRTSPGGGTAEIPSRMLTMIRGEMRQYLSSDADFTVLERWLAQGGRRDAIDAGEGRRTPRRILVRDCLRCHGQSTGTAISRQSPFGPDEFEIDFDRLGRFLPGADPAGAPARAAPQYTIERLVLVSHMHMLSIPLFTLVIAALFAGARFPARLRAGLMPVPMAALVMDFAGWWIARAWVPGVGLLWLGGAVFGVTFAMQLLVVVVDLWRPIARRPT